MSPSAATHGQGDDEGGDEAFARAFAKMPRAHLLPWSSWEPDGRKGGPTTSPKSKIKYTCPTCGANAWGKPELHLVCGEDDERMTAEDE